MKILQPKWKLSGYMADLNRIQVGEFNISDAISVQELQELYNNFEKIESKIISIEKIFKEKDVIRLDKRKLDLFLNGVKLASKQLDGVYRIYCDNEFVGTGIVENEKLKRDIIV